MASSPTRDQWEALAPPGDVEAESAEELEPEARVADVAAADTEPNIEGEMLLAAVDEWLALKRLQARGDLSGRAAAALRKRMAALRRALDAFGWVNIDETNAEGIIAVGAPPAGKDLLLEKLVGIFFLVQAAAARTAQPFATCSISSGRSCSGTRCRSVSCHSAWRRTTCERAPKLVSPSAGVVPGGSPGEACAHLPMAREASRGRTPLLALSHLGWSAPQCTAPSRAPSGRQL